ncbi:MAG: phosphoglycerate dehydrogenase [Pantoea sp.]|uniref:phosphoglycerate dehydrogenase n=1 Tax=Pantoea sp. TaxID=69393 RepID=UPI0039E296D0
MSLTQRPHLSLSKDKIKILLLEGIDPSASQLLNDAGYTNIHKVSHAVQGEELKQLIKDVHFIGVRSQSKLTADVLSAADKLVGVGCFCIGTNQVDLNVASEKGIPVFNAPFSNTRSVAELVIAESIMLLRGIPDKSRLAHEGGWLKSAKDSYEIRGKTLGIVGYGAIGAQLSVLAEAVGLEVLYYDLENKLPLGNARQIQRLEDLLAQSDIVSLHVPEDRSTEWMIDEQQIAACKPGSIMINASRGRVIRIEPLAEALKSGHLLGAALDVFPEEPGSNNERFISPLQGLANVILTPHIGGSTIEAQRNIGVEVAQKFIMYSDTGATTGSVNLPDVRLPQHEGKHRLIHVHRNVAGVLSGVNGILSRHSVNVAAQYLQTKNGIGYMVMDVDSSYPSEVIAELDAVEGTIRTRVLY